jgi:hypothetical protein
VSQRAPRARRITRLLRVTTALLAALVLAATAVPTESTEAAWRDAETGAATFTATTVPTPVRTSDCTATSGLLGVNPIVTVYWRLPEGVSGYTVTDAQFARESGGLLIPLTSALLGNVSTVGSPSGYTTQFSGGLLGGLLGGTMKLAVRFVGPGGWTSSWLVATATLPTLGGTGTCTLSTQPST